MEAGLSIAFFGDGPWAHRALRALVAEGFDVRLVVVRHDVRDPVLLAMAKEIGVPGESPANVNDAAYLARLAEIGADLGVSMSFDQILRQPFLERFPRGVVNCHAGKLPYYRGRNILNWALINDEKEIGVTCHYVDSGVDTGDVLVQKTFPVGDDDDYGTLLARAIELCPEVLVEAVRAIRDGTARRVPQPAQGTYFVQRAPGDEWIDWAWPSRRVFNFVRAITTPGPCARTWLAVDGAHVPVIVSRVREVKDAIPYVCVEGAVVGVRDGMPLVKTGDTVVAVERYEILGSARKKLRVGDRLGINVNAWLAKATAGRA